MPGSFPAPPNPQGKSLGTRLPWATATKKNLTLTIQPVSLWVCVEHTLTVSPLPHGFCLDIALLIYLLCKANGFPTTIVKENCEILTYRDFLTEANPNIGQVFISKGKF